MVDDNALVRGCRKMMWYYGKETQKKRYYNLFHGKLNLFNKFSYKATCFNHVNQEIFLNLYSKKQYIMSWFIE